MTEPFFAGSVSGFPTWTAIPWQGFGPQQPPFPGSTAPIGTGATGLGSSFLPPAAPSNAAFGVQSQPTGALTGVPTVSYAGPLQYTGLPGVPSAGGIPGYGFPLSWPAFGPVPGFSGSPAFAGPDASAGVTPAALVGVIAMKRGQPMGPTNDREIEEVIYDALEWLAGTNEIEARCEGGRMTLTGSVSNKRIKRDVGEVAWAIPSVTDVQNNVTITARRRGRQDQREQEPQAAATGRKQG